MPWTVQLALLCVLSTFKLDTVGVTQQLVDAISSAVAEHSAMTAAAAIAKMCAYSQYTKPCTGETQLADVFAYVLQNCFIQLLSHHALQHVRTGSLITQCFSSSTY
jgi:hypothetical protein